MADSISDRDYETLASLRHALRRFFRFSEEAAGAAGMTTRQYQALLAIRAAPGRAMPVGALADELLLRPHSATGLVDRLEAAGLVRRAESQDDKRQVIVALTPFAEDRMASIAITHREELRRMKPVLGDLVARL